jgi:hypothetical protein
MIINDNFLPATSAAGDVRTGPIAVQDYGNIAVGATFSGSDLAGSVSLEASFTRDFTRSFAVGTPTAVTAASDVLLNVSDINYPWVRVFWDYTSGTGNITVDYSIRQPKIWGGG